MLILRADQVGFKQPEDPEEGSETDEDEGDISCRFSDATQ